jgi:hypothetical protein
MKKERPMTHPHNPFGDFEEDFKKTEKADPFASPGRVPPETYKFILVPQDIKGDDVLVDHEIFVANSGTKGFKIFCEILDPETVINPKTKEPQVTNGVVIEHVFYVTQKNLPYIKRDIATILGRELASLNELPNTVWGGRTFEGVVQDDPYKGFVKSKIGFINAWAPKQESGPNPHGPATSSPPKPPHDQKVPPKKDPPPMKAPPTPESPGGSADF